jgi:hypothetical protein
VKIDAANRAFRSPMARNYKALVWLAALNLGLLACSPAHADRLAPVSSSEKALAHPPVKSPYQVELIGENGLPLKVYSHRGRFYVPGMVGHRYTIRLSNPTPRRVEAVISVDGLDVIDGKTADLHKRGYVVPPHGELRVDGFRVSTQQVATFRFSSVASSYAGRKGQARNVGVIGVAFFEEREAPQIVTPRIPAEPSYHDKDDGYDYHIDVEVEASASAERRAKGAPAPKTEHAPEAGRSADSALGGSGSAGAPRVSRKSSSAPAPARDEAYGSDSRWHSQPRQRPGLGTEFGEQRHSAVSWTQFVRANPTTPTALAELRYNDVEGLQALGIRIHRVDADELATRETADPFPGSRFAQPPPR